MIKFLRLEPALTTAVLSLLGAVLGIYIKNPELVAALVGVAAAMLGVRQAVVPTVKLPGILHETVEELNTHTVGNAGEVTDKGQGIIDSVLDRVLRRSGK